MAWYRIDLTPEQVAQGHGNALRHTVENVFSALSAPPGFAMFDAEGPGGGRICFFSPAAVQRIGWLMADHRAIPCQPPEPEAVSLRVGRPDAVLRLLGPEP
jgi:hypothetical protein